MKSLPAVPLTIAMRFPLSNHSTMRGNQGPHIPPTRGAWGALTRCFGEAAAEEGRGLQPEAPVQVDGLGDADAWTDRNGGSLRAFVDREWRFVQRQSIVRTRHAHRLTQLAGSRAERV